MEDLSSYWIVGTTDVNDQQQVTDDEAESGNGSSLIAYDNPTVEQLATCKWFTFTVYVIVLGFLCSFGLIGNTISFVVLRAEKHSHVATFLLQAMAVADNLFLVMMAVAQMTTELTEDVNLEYDDIDILEYDNDNREYDDIDNQLYYSHTFMTYVKVYVWPLVHVCQMWTVWITVLVAFNRYVAICLPFQAPRLCKMRQARIQVVCFAVSIWLYNVPRFLEHEVQWITFTNEDDTNVSMTISSSLTDESPFVEFMSFPNAVNTTLKYNRIYNIVYENVLYCFFVFLGPLVVLVFFNTCLIRELCLARRRLRERFLHGLTSGPEQGEHNLTLVMIIIVVVFVVCQTPAFVNQLMFVIGAADTCGRAYFYYYHLSNLLITANSAVNFVVYCVFRRHFRRRLRAFFCRCVGWNGVGRRRRGSDGSLVQPCNTEQNAGLELRTTSFHHRNTDSAIQH